MAIGTTAAIIGSAVIGAGASIIGGNKAAKAQQQGAEQATAEQRRQYDLTRSDMAPWREAGGKAIGSLSAMLQPGYDHTTSPGYQFRMDEGLRAVEGSAASKGLLGSGGTLKDIIRFSQGTAADDFNQQFNRTASVAAGGQQVNSQLGALGANMANNVGNNMMQAANARASGYANTANTIGGFANNLAGFAMMGGFGGGSAPRAGLVPSVNGAIASNPGLF